MMRVQLRFTLSATALIAATYGLSRFGFGLFLPAFDQEFHLTPTITGLISSGSFLSYCVAAALAYRMVGSPRQTVLLAGAVAATGSIGVALSGTTVVLTSSVIIAGAGAGFASPGLVTLVQENVSSSVAARAQAVVNSGTGFGVVIAGPLALILSQQWRTAWWIIGAINVAATIAVLVSTKPARAQTPEAKSRIVRFVDLRPLLGAAVAALLAGVSSAAVWTFSRSLVVTEGQMSETEATIFWVCLGSAGIAGALSGELVTRAGLRTGWTVTTALMGLSTALIGVWPSNGVAVYVGGAVFGASYVALSGVLIAWVTHGLPNHAAAGTAALFITLALGQAVGSLLIGGLQDATNPAVAFAIAAAIAGSSVISALMHTAVPRRSVQSVG